jgi:hypothetical protein
MHVSRRQRATERELTRLADGTLEPRRREQVERLVASSAELQARLHEQRRAVAAIRAARAERAPLALRVRARALPAGAGLSSKAGRRTRRRLPPAGGVALLGALGALLWAALAIGGGHAGPTAADAATVAARPPTMRAPAADADDATLPRLQVGGLPFPSWEARFGWRATGVRTDRVDGRTLTTVFYRRGHWEIAYSIVAGAPLSAGAATTATERPQLTLRSFSRGKRQIVTWLRRGHTCVLSGAGVPLGALFQLAAWRAGGQLPY